MKMIFGIESNGISHCSVLNFYALIIDDNNNIIEIIDRFYQRRKNEKQNYKAININGLEDEIIEAKRKNITYHKYFKADHFIDKLFKKVDTLIAYNIDFVLYFLSKRINIADKKIINIMKQVQYEYDTPYKLYEDTCHEEPKYPSLVEATEFFKIDIEEIKKRHESNIYKCYCTYEIYKKLQL